MKINTRLLKIVELARHGIDGEREAAIRMVKKVCAAEGLNYDDVMNSTEIETYVLDIPGRNALERKILAQICWAFAIPDMPDELRYNTRAKRFIYKTTKARHIECTNAASILMAAFRKERKQIEDDLATAFIHKHSIYGTDAGNNGDGGMDIETARRIMGMAQNMADVNIRKQIGGGDDA